MSSVFKMIKVIEVTSSSLLVLGLLLAAAPTLTAQCNPGTLFGPATDFATSMESRALAKGDFNEDGITDLATAGMTSTGAGVLEVLLGSGGGSFGAPATSSLPILPNAMIAGDFDDDGISDLAIAGGTGGPTSSAAVFIMLGTGAGGVGDGGFTAGSTTLVAPTFAPLNIFTAVVAGDFDENGISDLAVTSLNEPLAWVLLGQGAGGIGDGTFVASPTPALGGNGSYDIDAADFDEDGICDLAILHGWGGVQILMGQGAAGIGSGTFALGPLYVMPSSSVYQAILVGDFDRDGIFDLAVADGYAQVLALQGQGAAGVGNGSFAAPVPYASGVYPNDLANGDFNGDGVPDIAVARHCPFYSGQGNVALLLGMSQGGVPMGTFLPDPSYYTTPGFPKEVLVDDFDGDGIADLVLSKGFPHLTVVPGVCGQSLQQLAITAPTGSPTWSSGTNQTISWTKTAGILLVDVEVSRDGGLNWEPVARELTDLSFTWTVTDPASSQAMIRVRDSNLASRNAVSGSFQIAGALAAAATPVGSGCGAIPTSLSATPPVMGQPLMISLTGPIGASGLLVSADPLTPPLVVGGCTIYLDLTTALPPVPLMTDAAGTWFAITSPLPQWPELVGTLQTLQAIVLTPGSGAGYTLSNGVDLSFGY